MKIGYIRVSTIEQNTERQLKDIELDKVYIEKRSGKDRQRPELEKMIDFAREGDEIYTHDISRIARNSFDLLKITKELEQKKVSIHFLKEGISIIQDKPNPLAKCFLQIIGAVAELDRSRLLEAQKEGIAIAKANGVYLGREQKYKLSDIRAMKKEIDEGESKSQVAKKWKITRATLYRYLDKYDFS